MEWLRNLRALLTVGGGVFKGLDEESAGADPIGLFDHWLKDARRARIYLPESFALATATGDGVPAARMMLFKGTDAGQGFRFFTNFESRKADELTANPVASMVFYWPILHRQVRVEGRIEKLSEEESRAYHQTRPRGSQLGAWSSRQSSVIEDRRYLEESYREHERRFGGSDVPLPPFWGGYRLVAERIEFWQGRANRLHDRLRYTREGNRWRVERLSP